MQRGPVGADGETGDFKGLTLSNSGPGLLSKPGLSFRKARIVTGTTTSTPRPPGLGETDGRDVATTPPARPS
jgi:hypothetical protein